MTLLAEVMTDAWRVRFLTRKRRSRSAFTFLLIQIATHLHNAFECICALRVRACSYLDVVHFESFRERLCPQPPHTAILVKVALQPDEHPRQRHRHRRTT